MKFAREHKKALEHLLDDCYICTESVLRGLGSAGDLGISSWKCSCTCRRVVHNSCLANKLVRNGDVCDFCRGRIEQNGLHGAAKEEEEESSAHPFSFLN